MIHQVIQLGVRFDGTYWFIEQETPLHSTWSAVATLERLRVLSANEADPCKLGIPPLQATESIRQDGYDTLPQTVYNMILCRCRSLSNQIRLGW
jgi:hypothetical protein